MARWEPMLAEMLEERYGALKGYAVVLCGDPAEADDLVQDAIVATFSSRRRFDHAALAEGYVRRAIASRFLDARRKDGRTRRVLSRVGARAEDPAPGPDRLAQQAVDVPAALQQLPPRQRACVVLRHLDHLSTRETAEALGVSEGAVKRYLADGIATLAPLLNVPLEIDGPEWSETKVTR